MTEPEQPPAAPSSDQAPPTSAEPAPPAQARAAPAKAAARKKRAKPAATAPRAVPADPVPPAPTEPMSPQPAPLPHPPAGAHQTELAHHTPGRVRLKVPAAKNNPELLNQFRAAFENHPGIDGVIIKPATGSLVIHYDPNHHLDIVSLFTSLHTAGAPAVLPHAAAAAEHKKHLPKTKLDEQLNAIEEEAEYLAEHSQLARSIVDGVKSLDRSIKRATNNTVDLKILTPLGLAAMTFVEIGATAATPMWVTLAIFSLNHFVELRAHDDGEPDPEEVAAETT